jgi:hypothetical protein
MTAVWDLICFNDEVDLLEARFRLYDNVIDRFVVAEAAQTFSGLDKPLHLRDNPQFEPWRDRILRVEVAFCESTSNPWDCENASRGQLLAAATAAAAPDDLLLLCDVDEFPDRELIVRCKTELQEPAILLLDHSIYYGNWYAPEKIQHGLLFRASSAERMVALQSAPGGWGGAVIADGGIHLSFTGGPRMIARKLAAYSHQEINNPRQTDLAHLERCLRHAVHLTGEYVLKPAPFARWSADQVALYGLSRDLFSTCAVSSRTLAKAFCAFAWLRRRAPVPDIVVRALDRCVPWLLPIAAPLLVPIYELLQLRRRASR